MMWYDDGAWSWGDWLAMSGTMLLVAVGAIGITAWIITSLTGSESHGSLDSPRAALDRRLANGEIGEEEYARARRLIEDQGTRQY